jgi:predicted transcriptional regulator
MPSYKRIDVPQMECRVTVRLPPRLDAAIRQIAIDEATTPSTVARRMIAAGIAREQQRQHPGARGERG